MILDVLRFAGGPLLAAIIGGLLVHFATRRRDAENERRRQRIDYLIGAYRTLTHSAQRELSGERAEAFEDALSDVVLFGDDEQIRLARETFEALAQGGEAPVDALLVSFRSALRRELDLRHDGLQTVPVVRFKGLDDHHTPLKVQESWKVVARTTEAAVASAISVPRPSTAVQGPPVTVDLTSQIEGLRKLARAAPGAGVVASYGHVVAALRSLVDAQDGDERDAPALARDAASLGLVTPQLAQTVEGLAVLKDLSWRGGDGTGLSVEKADDYVGLVAAALYVLYTVRPGPTDDHQQAS